MAYTRYENQNGTVRLKVLMGDIKLPITHQKYKGGYEIFYTYSYWSGHGTYTFPNNYVIGQTIGQYTVTKSQYFHVISHKGDERLAEWTDFTTQDYRVYQSGGVLGVTLVTTDYLHPTGDSIDCVSNQITGDYMVHTYRYRENSNGKILDRKVRATNLETGKTYNFTSEDLKIDDVSPLGSDTKRWELLTAIGVFNENIA